MLATFASNAAERLPRTGRGTARPLALPSIAIEISIEMQILEMPCRDYSCQELYYS